MRGYLPIAMLVEFERSSGKRCCDIFDMAWGTSIGGIGASLIGCGVPATEVLKFFPDDGPPIFKKRFGHYIGIFGSRYKGSVIEGVLQKRTAGLVPKIHIGITSFDQQTQKPYMFKFVPGQNVGDKIWQATRATSSAQIFFPKYRVTFEDGPHAFVDGGNVANNPAMCAYVEAKKIWPNEEIVIYSLGCGDVAPKAPGIFMRFLEKICGDSLLWNALETIFTLFEASSEEVDYQLEQLIGSNYYRFQPALKVPLAIDGVSGSALDNLKEAASDAIVSSKDITKSFLQKIGFV